MTGVKSTFEQIHEGQRWTFVHLDGTETHGYIVASVETAGKPSDLVQLLNPATGKHAHVTKFWMWRPADGGHSHWLREHTEEKAA